MPNVRKYPLNPDRYTGPELTRLKPAARRLILDTYKPGDSAMTVGEVLGISPAAVRKVLQREKVYVPLIDKGAYARRLREVVSVVEPEKSFRIVCDSRNGWRATHDRLPGVYATGETPEIALTSLRGKIKEVLGL